ncbi:uncharacterized protein LOC120346261 isoform X1 [Styela clava]
MDNCCPPRLNHEYVKSVEGILKLSLIVIGVFCWGIVYIGDVMSTSNEAPEINDQVLFYSALTLPSWLLTLLTFIFYMFSRSEIIPFKLDAALNAIFAILYIACVCFSAGYEWFVWICESGSSSEVVDTGECPNDRILRNSGQNLAVVVIGSVLAGMYALATIYTLINMKTWTYRRKSGYAQPATPGVSSVGVESL